LFIFAPVACTLGSDPKQPSDQYHGAFPLYLLLVVSFMVWDLTYKFSIYLELILDISQSGRWWLMPVSPATQEAEIKRFAVRSQPGQTHTNSSWEPISKIPTTKEKKGVWGCEVAQGIGPEFKSHTFIKMKTYRWPIGIWKIAQYH
jgi:hypothetical protein